MTPVQPDIGVAEASVVVCSRERPTLLTDTVRSVLAARSVPRELVVVDQSESANAELAALGEVRGCRVRYVHSATSGLSRARNIGIREASETVVVLLDDDMFVDDDWLTTLLSGLSAGGRAVATGRVLAAPPEGRAGVVPPAALVTRETPDVYRGAQPADVVPGANVALPRELVLALGGYDERLGAGTRYGAADDNDMGHRLLLAGCEVRHVPEAVVFHRAWRPQNELVGLRWRYGRGKGAFYAKHIAGGDRHMLGRLRSDAGRRLRAAGAAAVRSPRTTVAELITLGAMASGALQWLLIEGFERQDGEARPY